MTITTIDRDRAIELLRSAVEKKGEDYEYERFPMPLACRYTADGEPSCIVGHALYEVGVPIEELERLDSLNGDGAIITSLIDNGELPELEFTDGAARAFRLAQSAQDEGHSWGSALAYARRTTEGER